jgi:hypothetical protein
MNNGTAASETDGGKREGGARQGELFWLLYFKYEL